MAAVTAAAMAGELDFAASLARRVALLEGLPAGVLDAVRARITVTDGVPELVAAVHAAGGAVAAVSGGFRQVLDPLAAELGLDRWRANDLAVVDDRLAGRVEGQIDPHRVAIVRPQPVEPDAGDGQQPVGSGEQPRAVVGQEPSGPAA